MSAVGLVCVLLTSFPLSAAGATSAADEPDSIKNVLELSLNRAGLEEVAGNEVMEFRLYTTADRSVVAWWREKTLYVYPLSGTDHEARAAALIGLLRQHGLTSFVVERKAKRLEGFNQVAVVKALQVTTPLRSGSTGKGG